MSDASRDAVFAEARDAVAAALPRAWAIYAYGSFARGDAWPGSDLDLAVLLPPNAAIADKLELIAEVSRRAGREADIVDLRTAGLDLVAEVLRDGLPLLVRDEDQVLGWEAERMSDYGAFNPRRAGIVQMYMQGSLRA